jgi:hypothetical protein
MLAHSTFRQSLCLFLPKKGGPVMTLDGKCVLIVEDDNIALGL